MEGDDGPVVDDWRKEGTCGACAFFRTDFGAPPNLYGHCKIYTRTGSRGSSDYACPEFKPLPGFEQTVVLAEKVIDADAIISARAGKAGRTSRGGKVRRRRPVEARVVRRRADGQGPPRVEDKRVRLPDTRPLDQDIVAALTGGEGGGDVDRDTLRDVLLEVVEQFIGVEDVELGQKWHGGTLTMQPEDPSLKANVMPIETFFHKIVMVRDRLRVLEAKINGNSVLSDAEKVELQQYISRCYGSLTSFNVLFKHKGDKFSSR